MVKMIPDFDDTPKYASGNKEDSIARGTERDGEHVSEKPK
jgi:hypothetical protein